MDTAEQPLSKLEAKAPQIAEEGLSFEQSYERFLKRKKQYEENLPRIQQELGEIAKEVRKFEEESKVEYPKFLAQKSEIMPALRAQNEEIKQLVENIKEELDEKFKFLEKLVA